MRELPPGRFAGCLRSSSPGRRQFHEHLAQPADQRPVHSHPQYDADQQPRLAQRSGRIESRRFYSAGERRIGRHATAGGGNDCAHRIGRDRCGAAGRSNWIGRRCRAASFGCATKCERASRVARRRRSEELRAGDGRHAPQTGSGRLADRSRRLSGLEPQRALASHARQREGPAAGVVLEHE